MHVGDGTWDSSRDSFLLPNIQGLNFDTMRYNGMGNRFQALEEYHSLITAHGVFAAITFLAVVPTAIFVAKFYYPDPRLALRIHISLQILTVILATVILLLGYFAVGPSRSLTNPHHGIGVAIYVLVLVQAIGGAIIHRIEKGKMRYYIPVKLMLHQWVGRAIALLALAQIPIGLTLYGSPAYLFVLYTLVVASLVILYFVLTFKQHKRIAAGFDEKGSYMSGTQTDVTGQSGKSQHRGRFGTLAGAAAGGAGIAALKRRFSNRGRDRGASDQNTDLSGSGMHSRVDSSSSLTGKYSDTGRRDGGQSWQSRLFGGTASAGAFASMRHLFDRRKQRDHDRRHDREEAVDRRPPLGGAVTTSMDHVDRLEAGLPVSDEDRRWRSVEQRDQAQATAGMHSGLSRRTADSSGDYLSETSDGNHHSRLGPLAGVAGAVGLGGWLSRRRSRKEQQRIDAQRRREHEEERLYRPTEQQPLYPGDDTPRRDGGVRFDPNLPGGSANDQQQSAPPPPPPQPQFVPGPYATYPPPQSIPPPPANESFRGPPDHQTQQNPQNDPYAGLPPVPPLHQSGASSAASMRNSPSRQQGPYVSNRINNTINSRAPPPNFQPEAPKREGPQQPLPVASPPRTSRNNAYASPGPQIESPAVSLRVKPGRDGRHVTVQQLNADQAAQQRERQRQRQGSVPSAATQSQPSSGPQVARQYPPQMARQAADGQQSSELHLPASQQGQQTSPEGAPSGMDSSAVTGPAGAAPGGYDTGTESYDNRRRRRRAERARNQSARQGSAAPSAAGRVDFE